jgi:hypothetical protein
MSKKRGKYMIGQIKKNSFYSFYSVVNKRTREHMTKCPCHSVTQSFRYSFTKNSVVKKQIR